MRIGVDFDNTIVCYDGLFRRLAVEKDLVPPDIPQAKNAVRDYLRQIGQEDRWTELQGFVYGPGMSQARLFPGAAEFFARCGRSGREVFIISHRTRYPYLGERYDLHAAARDFLAVHGFSDRAGIGPGEDRIHFLESKEEKVARINELGCTHFIDDLPEFLAAPGFAPGIRKILFDPNGLHSDEAHCRVASWAEIEMLLLEE